MEEIPDQLGSDSSKCGTKHVEITAVDDKRQITAVFGYTLTGDFLPMQLIFTGITQKCLLKVDFPGHYIHSTEALQRR